MEISVTDETAASRRWLLAEIAEREPKTSVHLLSRELLETTFHVCWSRFHQLLLLFTLILLRCSPRATTMKWCRPLLLLLVLCLGKNERTDSSIFTAHSQKRISKIQRGRFEEDAYRFASIVCHWIVQRCILNVSISYVLLLLLSGFFFTLWTSGVQTSSTH